MNMSRWKRTWTGPMILFLRSGLHRMSNWPTSLQEGQSTSAGFYLCYISDSAIKSERVNLPNTRMGRWIAAEVPGRPTRSQQQGLFRHFTAERAHLDDRSYYTLSGPFIRLFCRIIRDEAAFLDTHITRRSANAQCTGGSEAGSQLESWGRLFWTKPSKIFVT